jgi:hypothetical protein
MRYCEIPNYSDMMLIPSAELESTIRDYILYLRRDKKTSTSQCIHLHSSHNPFLRNERLNTTLEAAQEIQGKNTTTL